VPNSVTTNYIVQIEFLQLNFAIELVSGPSSVTIFAFFPMLLTKAKAAVAKPKDVPISKIVSGSK
jgi:hypothetical protein